VALSRFSLVICEKVADELPLTRSCSQYHEVKSRPVNCFPTLKEFEISSKCDSEGLAHEFKKLNTLLMLPHSTRSVRQGWVFSERTRNLSGFHFTRHFIAFVCEETNQFDGNNPNVIAGIMQQT